MSLPVLSRRSAISALAISLATPLLTAGAFAQQATRFRAIEVDVNNVRRSGDHVSADRIARELPALLQRSFAGHLAPGDRGAPVLRARVDLVTYGSNGSATTPGNPYGAKDYIEGAGVVIGAGGRVVSTYPLLTAVIANPDLTDITGQSGRTRTSNLAASFAQWLPGKMGV
jgi:hypothetical protein